VCVATKRIDGNSQQLLLIAIRILVVVYQLLLPVRMTVYKFFNRHVLPRLPHAMVRTSVIPIETGGPFFHMKSKVLEQKRTKSGDSFDVWRAELDASWYGANRYITTHEITCLNMIWIYVEFQILTGYIKLASQRLRSVFGLKQQALYSLNAELNPICPLLALFGVHHILHVSRIRVKLYSTMEIIMEARY